MVSDRRRFTHIRLSAFPDGGIARLRVFGSVVPDPRLFDGLTVDLASQDHGGQVVASSDGFYTSAAMLNRPDRARTMGEGWETRRRRDDGNDHAMIRLALPGTISQIEIDTAHFKYNASAEISFGAHGSELLPANRQAGFRYCRAGVYNRTPGMCSRFLEVCRPFPSFGSMHFPMGAFRGSGCGEQSIRQPAGKRAIAGSTRYRTGRQRICCWTMVCLSNLPLALLKCGR